MSRFGGIPVETEGSRFGGVPVEQEPLTLGNMHKFAIQGLTGEEIDTETGLDFWSRFDLSFSDTDEEKANKFSSSTPNGKLVRVNIPELNSSYLLFKNDLSDPDEKWKTVEDEGWSVRDVADIAGGVPEFAGATAPFLIPGVREAGIAAQALAAGGGAMIGHLGKEAVEQARGTQLQPWTDVLYDAAGKGALTAATTAGVGVAQKGVRAVTGGGYFDLPADEQAVLETLKTRPELLAKTPISVISPEHKILHRLTMQAVSTSKKGQQFLNESQKVAVKELEKLVGPDDFAKISDEMATEMGKVLGKGKALVLAKTRRTPLEQGGKAAITGLKDDFVRNSSNVNKTLYGQVDEAAERLQPQFDLSKAIAKAKEIKQGVMGDDAVQVVGPNQELLSIIDTLVKMDPTQTDYKAVKALRTRIFNLVDNQPWQWDSNKFNAQRLWNELSEVLVKPTNQADDYVKAIKTASAFNVQRAGILADDHIQKIMQSSRPVNIGEMLSQKGAFTDNVEYALTKFAPKKAKEVKDSVKYFWLTKNPGKALDTIQEMKRIDPGGFSRVVRNDEVQSVISLAKELDKLNSSRMAQVFKKQLGAGKLVRGLIEDQDVNSVKLMVKQLGGQNGKGTRLLKAGVIEDMLNQSTEITAKNTLTINPKKFAGLWKEYNRNGILDEILTPADKQGLLAIKSYVQLWERKVDPGVSLEAAQLISLLKHPKTFVQGTHGLAMNEMLAWVLLSPKTRDFLVGKGTQPISGAMPKVMAIALADMFKYADASNEEPLLEDL